MCEKTNKISQRLIKVFYRICRYLLIFYFLLCLEIRQALAIAQNTGAGPVEAEAWYATGELARLGGETAPALEAYARAQAVAGTGTAPDLLWQIHYGRAQSLILGGERQAAVSELEAAVLIIESVRARLQDRYAHSQGRMRTAAIHQAGGVRLLQPRGLRDLWTDHGR